MIAGPKPKRESVANLRGLLGQGAQLLRFPLGSKKPQKDLSANDERGLKSVTISGNNLDVDSCNVVVLVGPRSDNVISVDCDTDDVAELFRQANPLLCENTLVTKGAKGCNYWFKIDGKCPPFHHLYYDGADVGELRSADGDKLYWTVIQGDHPSGCSYEIVNRVPVATVTMEDLVWVDGRPLAEIAPKTAAPEDAVRAILGRSRRTMKDVPLEALEPLEPLEPLDVNKGGDWGQTHPGIIPEDEIEKAISDFTPDSHHQTNSVQFRFARRIKRLAHDYKANPNLFAIGGQWYEAAKHNLRPEHEQDKEDYIMEFIHRYGKVQKAEGETLMEAWKLAQMLPPHPSVLNAPPNVQALQRLCLILAQMTGNRTFTLGGAHVVDLIGNRGSDNENSKRRRGRRYLGALETLGVISLIKRGHQGVCSSYEYLLDDL